MSRPATLTAEREVDVELPDSVRERLASFLVNETIAHAVNSDMRLDGTYDNESWLVITHERLIVLDRSHPNGILMVPLTDLTTARVRQLYGNAVLELRLAADVPADSLLQVTPSPVEEVETPAGSAAVRAMPATVLAARESLIKSRRLFMFVLEKGITSMPCILKNA